MFRHIWARTFHDGQYIGDVSGWWKATRQGSGEVAWSKGGVWKGNWSDDRPHTGSGTLHRPDGTFEGSLVEGRRAQGKMQWSSGDTWVGEWRDDKSFTGTGSIHHQNGMMPEGAPLPHSAPSGRYQVEMKQSRIVSILNYWNEDGKHASKCAKRPVTHKCMLSPVNQA